MPEPIFELDDVTLRGPHRPRLAGVSLAIGRGVTAVLGPSGSGKTSLLNVLVGFERPDAGARRFVAGEGSGLPLFWAPADHGLWPQLDVRATLLAVTDGGDRQARVAEMLADFDLEDAAAQRPHQLSQGQRSRTALARALLSGALVLVLDEPLAHVDAVAAERYWRRLAAVARDLRALVFATHDAAAVLRQAEHAICLDEGRVTFAGRVGDLWRRPPSRAAALCLGEADWLTAEEARLFLGDGQAVDGRDVCVRPAWLDLVPAAEGPLVVRQAEQQGGVAETEVVHQATGAARRVRHRSGAALVPGARAVLRLLGLCLLLLAGACDADAEAAAARSFVLPLDGTAQPAPRAIAPLPNGERLVLDTNGRILVLAASGELLRQWRMPEVAAGKPEGACAWRDGEIVVADTHYHRLVCFDTTGRVLRTVGRQGRALGEFLYPVKVCRGEDRLYVAEYGGNDRVQVFDADLRPLRAFGAFGTAADELQRPSGVVWLAGRVYVSDAINERIQVFAEDGRHLATLAADGVLRLPYDLAADAEGRLWVAEFGAGRVTALSTDGRVLARFGRPGSGPGELRTPWGLAAGAPGTISVADTGNRRVVELRVELER